MMQLHDAWYPPALSLPPPAPPNPYQGLRRLSRAAGAALLLVCVLQQLLALVIAAVGRFAPQVTGSVYWEGFTYLLVAVLAVYPGALLGFSMLTPEDHNLALAFRKRPAPQGIFPENSTNEKPQKQRPLAVFFAGVFLCMVSNAASSVISAIAGQFGVGFQGPVDVVPNTAGSFLFMLFTVAVVPAVTEEIFMRGMVMQPLRRYGDGFALVSSALLFALLHQNMVQAPMAFCSGLVLGWAAQRSGSLWLPILIHFWNNAASVALSAAMQPLGAQAANRVFLLYGAVLSVLGIVGILVTLNNRVRRAPGPPALPHRARSYFFGTAAMAIALVYFAGMFALGVRL